MKTTKMFIYMVAALGLMAMPASADDRYRVTLPESRIGGTTVSAGEYSVVVDGTAVTVTELKTGKVLPVTAKVLSLEKKNSSTEVYTQKEDGVTKISQIRPGGAKISIDFREPTTP